MNDLQEAYKDRLHLEMKSLTTPHCQVTVLEIAKKNAEIDDLWKKNKQQRG